MRNGPETLLFAALLTVMVTPAVIALAARIGLLDHPNERSSHFRAVPRGGGIAVMICATLVAALVTEGGNDERAVLIGSLSLALVGLLDDRRGLPAVPRLAAQVAIPLLLGLVAVDSSGFAYILAVAVGVSWSVGYVNAFNFMDGINGIACSQAAIAATFLAFIARDVDMDGIELASWALAGASIGFLPFNAFRARIFLGDTGSYGIGFWLASSALLLLQAGADPIVLTGPFILYVADTSVVLLRRARRGDSLFEAHREHAYQLLAQAGWSHISVASLCAAISMATAAIMLAVRDAGVAGRLAGWAASLLFVGAYLRLASAAFGHRRRLPAVEP